MSCPAFKDLVRIQGDVVNEVRELEMNIEDCLSSQRRVPVKLESRLHAEVADQKLLEACTLRDRCLGHVVFWQVDSDQKSSGKWTYVDVGLIEVDRNR